MCFFFFYFAARNTSVALAYCKNYRYEKSPQSRPVWVPLMARLYLSAAIAASELNAPVVKFIYLFFVSWKVKFQEVKLDMHLLGTWQIFRRGNVLLFKLYFDVCYYIVLVVEVDFCLKLTYVYINSYKHRMFTFGSGEIFRNSQRFFFFFFFPAWLGKRD